ncbi:hypothetical protein SAMN03159341_12420 [Paenibacillus sp. 1_12]|uniref:hypothetical protein n=1 Tax=Paenibacillus sp. 1_12 TaxID=1566278 RepID=UPI0008EE2075|nr:hypothetical protein [Paenibacillus sp. 1_12]SFM28407.1 hypothetical protein SAMN03159341_12420 [Paenibacillus sp. 1_12]
MSQPSIPNITPTISITIGSSVALLLASIALEELALAHILNAEAEKIQFVLGTLSGVTHPTPTISNVLEINSSVRSTMQDVIKTEILLQFKLENILNHIAITA